MLKSVVLASYSYGGNSVGDFLYVLEQADFFSLVLPFLLIFALVYGILTKIKIFADNKAVNGIIALVVGLMSLQFGFVSQVFPELFSRTGVGLAILLVVIILGGMFLPKAGWANYTLFGIAGVVLVIVLVQTGGSVGWGAGNWFYYNWQLVAGAVVILIIIGIIVGTSGAEKDETKKFSKFMSDLFGSAGK
ncbi:MAG: hypothetical protein WC584_03350 [Candidatus Pacearchaeota archaeon]